MYKRQVVDELAVVELPVSAEDQEVSVKTEKVRLMSLRVHKQDTLRIKDCLLYTSHPVADTYALSTASDRALFFL